VGVELGRMREEHFASWIADAGRRYAESREEAGDTRDQARVHAERSMLTYFPEGRPLDGHFLYDVVADGETVGALWIGPHPQTPDGMAWWVYNLEIEEEFRRHGYARAAMELAEEEIRKLGGTSLGLNVFGWNTAARLLYESLGYRVTSLQLRKSLPGAAGHR
jgi:ribosomal protein S18 acetylase RimI-like enzyme